MKPIPGLLYTSPHTFTRKQRFLLAIIPPLAAGCLKLLAGSCRKEIRDEAYWRDVDASRGHALWAFWHESVGLAAHCYRNSGFHTLTSYSYDGELAARMVRCFGLFAIRGSSSRGGSEALANLAEATQHTRVVGISLDGPRGPRRVAKPGVAILAARTRMPIIPVAFAAAPVWRLHSWDQFAIPKPFARLTVAFGAPIPPPEDASEPSVEATRQQVEITLNQLHTQIEAELAQPQKNK